MAIHITMSRDAFEALAGLTATKAGLSDPCCALHIRRYDDYALEFAATNGDLVAYARLLTDSEQLDEVIWGEGEEEIVSLKVNDAATKMGVARLTGQIMLTVYESHGLLRSVGDEGAGVEFKLPRVRMANRNPFTSAEWVSAGVRDLTPRGQLVPPTAALQKIAKMGADLGFNEPGNISVAQLGKIFGFSFGSQDGFFALCRCLVTETAAVAGLPPDWVTGNAPAGERGGFEATAVHLLDTVLGPEQVELPLEDGENPELEDTSEDGSDFGDAEMPEIPEDEEPVALDAEEMGE